jgi:hypothetical protein
MEIKIIVTLGRHAPKGGRGACSPPPKSELKNIVDVMISNISRGLLFSRNQALKWADG